MLVKLEPKLRRTKKSDPQIDAEALQWVFEHTPQFQKLVELARQFCEAQNQALLNKLSRAFQKPDFYIRRDSVGDARDQLLPMSVSWDADWYYGRTVAETPRAAASEGKSAAMKRDRVAQRGRKRTQA